MIQLENRLGFPAPGARLAAQRLVRFLEGKHEEDRGWEGKTHSGRHREGSHEDSGEHFYVMSKRGLIMMGWRGN